MSTGGAEADDESAASLAEERVTLEDMRIYSCIQRRQMSI